VQAFAISGSVGHALPGLKSAHDASTKIKAVIIKAAFLCKPIKDRKGKLPYKEATTAPIPKLTRTIGITQQTSVVDDVKRINHPHCLGFLKFSDIKLFTFLNKHNEIFARNIKYLKIVIPECFCRESSDFTEFKVTGSPTEAFGDDENMFRVNVSY